MSAELKAVSAELKVEVELEKLVAMDKAKEDFIQTLNVVSEVLQVQGFQTLQGQLSTKFRTLADAINKLEVNP